jgi:hypothetical protein
MSKMLYPCHLSNRIPFGRPPKSSRMTKGGEGGEGGKRQQKRKLEADPAAEMKRGEKEEAKKARLTDLKDFEKDRKYSWVVKNRKRNAASSVEKKEKKREEDLLSAVQQQKTGKETKRGTKRKMDSRVEPIVLQPKEKKIKVEKKPKQKKEEKEKEQKEKRKTKKEREEEDRQALQTVSAEATKITDDYLTSFLLSAEDMPTFSSLTLEEDVMPAASLLADYVLSDDDEPAKQLAGGEWYNKPLP